MCRVIPRLGISPYEIVQMSTRCIYKYEYLLIALTKQKQMFKKCEIKCHSATISQ
jgi:hypothetical protein